MHIFLSLCLYGTSEFSPPATFQTVKGGLTIGFYLINTLKT